MPRTVHALALVSALCSAGATIFIRQGLRGRGPYTGFWINLVVGTVGLWAAVLLTGGFGHPSAAGVAFFVLAGLIGTVAGRLLRFVSIDKVGASVAASLINLHPLVATGVAILLLGERVTAPILGARWSSCSGRPCSPSAGSGPGSGHGRLRFPCCRPPASASSPC